jgi:hypothetical protein
MKLGGKQEKMRDGWYIKDSTKKVAQKICFTSDHAELPGEPKKGDLTGTCGAWPIEG